MQQRKIIVSKLRAGKNRGFTTKDEPVKDILCAYELSKFCSPECSACLVNKGIEVMCMRSESCIGNLPEE